MPLARGRASAWRIPRSSALPLLALVLLATPPIAAAGAPESRALLAEINEVRLAHGLRPLRPARSLHRSSGSLAHRLMRNHRFGHPVSTGIPRRFRLQGEVLARSSLRRPSADRVVRQWLASPTHRAVLLNRRFRFVGLGVARGRLGVGSATLVTGHFGGRLKPRRRR